MFAMKRKKFPSILSDHSAVGLLHKLYLRLVGKELVVTGKCIGCGSCCRNINLETERGWLRNPDEFLALAEKFPDYARFAIVGKDAQGFLTFRCSWIGENGLCREYERRLSICRSYPESSLFFCGCRLLDGCGYAGAAVLKNELERKG